jgi:hypothetical protein
VNPLSAVALANHPVPRACASDDDADDSGASLDDGDFKLRAKRRMNKVASMLGSSRLSSAGDTRDATVTFYL